MRRLIAALAAGAALLPLAARADGEAGLVIQIGDQVTTYCVPFEGESIGGEALLAASGLPVERFGGGSGVAICAIGNTGCFDPSSFDSCFCQCRGSDCAYWAFFTRPYGARWVYSSVGISLAKAKDGDVHGWKWGRGGPASAPAPADITFEQICGHPPRGGAAPTATSAPATPTLRPSPTGVATVAVTVSPSPTAPQSPSPEGSAMATVAPSPSAAAAITIIARSPVATVAPSPAAAPEDDDSAAVPRVAAFAAVVAALLVAIAGAAMWRQRRGR